MPAAPPIESLLDAVGGTPTVRLRRVIPAGAAAVYAKLEQHNPGGSVKDRICLAMIEDAERRGALRSGGTVVEPTSGNTGVGLALVCRVKGYRLVLTMPDSMSMERRQTLESYGVEVVLTPAEQGMEAAIRKAEEIARRENAFMPQQFENAANPEIHRRTTAREILAAMEAEGGGPDAFVAGVGTGGTVTGVGTVLKRERPGALVVAVEPASCAVLSGKPPGPTKIQGLGAGFVPAVLDRAVIDRIVAVEDRPAWDMKDRLAREEGMLVGVSAGAAVVAARQIAEELGAGKRVVVIVPDTGERYFSLAEYFQ
jgi:cysteine synthase A